MTRPPKPIVLHQFPEKIPQVGDIIQIINLEATFPTADETAVIGRMFRSKTQEHSITVLGGCTKEGLHFVKVLVFNPENNLWFEPLGKERLYRQIAIVRKAPKM